jgi:hypothetical protein
MLTAALLLGIAMLAAPSSAATPGQTQASGQVMKVAAHTPVDTRINNLHTRLQITADQESLWQPVAQVMRDNASTMDSLRQARAANANMSAVDDLRSYGQVVDAHADGVGLRGPLQQHVGYAEAQCRSDFPQRYPPHGDEGMTRSCCAWQSVAEPVPRVT